MERAARRKQFLMSDELLEGARAHAFGQGRVRLETSLGLFGKEVEGFVGRRRHATMLAEECRL